MRIKPFDKRLEAKSAKDDVIEASVIELDILVKLFHNNIFMRKSFLS